MENLPPPPFEPKIEFELIPFMHWGIISHFNFSNLRNVPVKRWDPLSSTSIEFSNLKQYGHYTYISPVRAERVDQFKDRQEHQVEPHPDFIDAFKATQVPGASAVATDAGLAASGIIPQLAPDGSVQQLPPDSNSDPNAPNVTGKPAGTGVDSGVGGLY